VNAEFRRHIIEAGAPDPGEELQRMHNASRALKICQV
jgi:hypothetical protein